jgi:hypothetical protein
MTQAFDRRPASDLHARGETIVGWSGYGLVSLLIAREPVNSVEDRVLAIRNRVSELLRRACAGHRLPGNVADEVVRGLIGRGERRAIDGVTRAFA